MTSKAQCTSADKKTESAMTCTLGKLLYKLLSEIDYNTATLCCAGIDDLKDVLDMVIDVGKEWVQLGLALGLRKPTLNKIAADNNSVDSCKTEMLSKWLNWVDGCEETCNWESLAKALRDPNVGQAPIAKAIEQKYSIK